MSQREEKLWKDFVQGIWDDNEEQVKRILLETGNLYLDGGKSNFLTRKITTTQGTFTVLHLAVKNGAEKIIKLLFENGVNVNATSQPHKFTALHMAVEQDSNGMIQLLLSQKEINVDACDEFGHTPLKLAAEKGNQQTVKWLIEKGADVTIADLVDNTAIHVAADKGHYDMLQLLLPVAFAKNPGIIGKQNKDKNTPLHLAVARECQNSVALLLCYGAVSSLELENRHNETPKQLAKGNKGILELLENPLKAKQHLMELTRPVFKVTGRSGSTEAESVMYVATPQVTVRSEYHTGVRDGGYAVIGPQIKFHVGPSTLTPTGVQPQLPSIVENSYSINVSGGNASVGDHSVTNVETATPRTPSSARITEDHFELPKRTQFKGQTKTSFKMSAKGGFVEDEGGIRSYQTSCLDKDPFTELEPQDSHDTGLPGATSDSEEENWFSRFLKHIGQWNKPQDQQMLRRKLENVVATAIDFEANHKECVRVLPYSDDDHTKVQFYVFSGKSGVPQKLKDAAQECFGKMKVKLEWFDLYNDATEILKVTPIEFPSGKPERLNESQIYEISGTISKNLHVLVKHRNVTAVQASFKITNSKQTKQPCIAIYVLGKGSIPVGEFEFPRTLGGYDVDVVDGFWFTTGEDDPWRPNEGQEQCEVLCLGASIGVEGEEGCGTLGAIVEGDGNFYALSCDHVMKRAKKSEIIHPARDDYLNYLNYHLQQYVERIQYIIKREQRFLPETISQFSFGIIKDLERLKIKFQELRSLKEEHYDQDRAKKGNLEKVELHEKALENGFKTPPRVIGRYIAGISRNMRWTDGQEYFIDAAIAQLSPKEVRGLIESETVEMIGTGKSPSGRCSSRFTAFGELCKSGRTTEYTNSGRHANPNVYLRLSSYKLNAQNKHLIDVVKRVSICHTCAYSAGVEEDLEPTFSPCGFCRVDTEALNVEVWWKNCLCIDRPYDPTKGDAFSAGGDSGAVIFEIEEKKSLLGFGIIFAQQCHSYGSCALASPLLPTLQTLSREIPVTESLSLFSKVLGIPSESDTGESSWWCNIV